VKTLKVSSQKLKNIIQETAKFLKEGNIIISPTDTVYGLLCDATNKKAVEKIFRIKKRPKAKPIPIFVKDIKMAKKLAFVDKKKEKFLKKVWPGKVTVVLKRKQNCGLPKIIFSKEKTIGLRIPNYNLINTLLKKLSIPLTATSANISGKLASIRIKEIKKQFKKEKEKPDLILDAGNLKFSLPSIVIDLTGKKIKILRI
jgi:L-threonylcarbamoyladenylate synthase